VSVAVLLAVITVGLVLVSTPTATTASVANSVPKVSGISPSSGPAAGGTAITIAGTGFVTGATVKIGQGKGAGSVAATQVTVVSPTKITAVTGGGAQVGTWPLFVITSGGTSAVNAKDLFTYQISPGPPVTYTTFVNAQDTLTPWVGQNVAILTPLGQSFDTATMSKIIGALDAAWNYYASITGRQPTPYSEYQGRDTIAVVTTSCGAACSLIGLTGTEINPSYFQTLYDGVQNNNQYDQALFYEFGRNFWFYESQLAPSTTYGSTATTGFAVLMRFESMGAIGVQGAPYDGTPFSTFQAQVWGIAGYYDSDLTKTFANTLAVGVSPSVYGGTDFFASIVHLLATHYGGDCFIQHFLAAAINKPSVTTDDAAVSNFIMTASQVAGANLGSFFYNYWGFPQPNGTTNPRVAGGIAALPASSRSAVCHS
jgi:hypothetical protein